MNEAMDLAKKGTFLFGVSYALGWICGSPKPWKGALITTVSFVAHGAIAHLAKFLGTKYNWHESTTKLVKALGDSLVIGAMAITLFAIGILNPLGVLIFTLVPMSFVGHEVFCAVRSRQLCMNKITSPS